MDLAQGALGPEGKYDLEFADGKFMIKLNYEGALAGASVELHIGAHQVIDAIKKAIPGSVDDTVLDILEAALLPKA